MPGKDLPGVIAYRDVADTDAMIDAAAKHKHAVVIGAGLLGLEAANGLALRGMDVTVVHIADWIMERQLDKPAADMLQKSLEKKGLKFLLPKFTAELVAGESGQSAQSSSGWRHHPADLVVMAAGIRPNTALAESAGIHCDRGISVNDTMQTYDPRIYAVGECANHRGIAYGLVAPLFEQAKVCANHLAMYGIGSYKGSVTSTKLKVTGIDVFSAGDFSGGEGTEDIVLNDPGAGVYKRVVLRTTSSSARSCMATPRMARGTSRCSRTPRTSPRSATTCCSVTATSATPATKGNSLASSMPDSAEVCGCNGVCKGTIVKAIQEHGLFTLDDVRKHTKASSSCGSCTGLVEQILASTIGGAYQPADSHSKAVCGCTDSSHGEVRKAIREHKLLSVQQAIDFLEWKTPNGCASCRPALNYYCISTWPHEATDDAQSRFINERAHANIQKDGTYSVVPRMWGGLTTPMNCAPLPTRPRNTRCRRSRSPVASASTCSA